jgi:DNA invertase Pin-like site-specific DNA recombinase
MTRALLYCRVAENEQIDASDLIAQETALVEEATRRGFDFQVIREGTPAPGTSVDKLVEALELLDEHKADVLMAVRLDRLIAGEIDAPSLVHRSEAMGWGLIIAGEPLGAEHSIVRVISTNTELERRSRSVRTREGMQQRKRDGASLGRTVDRNFLAVYRRVVGMAEDGASMNGIARILNDEAVPTATGGTWYASTVRAILTSETAKKLA